MTQKREMDYDPVARQAGDGSNESDARVMAPTGANVVRRGRVE